MKWPRSEEFSGAVNCSHLGIALVPLDFAVRRAEKMPSAERTAAPRLETKSLF